MTDYVNYPSHPHRYLRHELMALPGLYGEGIAVSWPYKEEWYYEERRRYERATYKRCGKHGVTDCLVCETNEPEGRAKVRVRQETQRQARRKARRAEFLAEWGLSDE